MDINTILVTKLVVSLLLLDCLCRATNFDENYGVIWGKDHAQNSGSRVQLSLDQTSGAGFATKSNFGSGFFHMKIKLPGPDAAGVVTAYYLSSGNSGAFDDHDELDFEFLGNREGKPYILQTNIFVNGKGGREQRLHLWFDPRDDFHTYKFLWNQHQIVFYVDNIPIRQFKNLTKEGVGYPTKAMKVQTSIWNGESWATDGGNTKINWTHSPFLANFEGFNVHGCPIGYGSGSDIQSCDSPHYDWNNQRYWKLTPSEAQEIEKIKKKYFTYDYCSDRSRWPNPPPDCMH